ncbi:MAG TPA: MFS transporter [Haliangium sp.]|nr:MFS transporter [Haliangium sp.]
MKATRKAISNTRFGLFLGGNLLNDIAQGTAISAITYLVLQNAGLASVSLVQGAPLLVKIFGAPVLAAFADRFSARNVVIGAMAGTMLVALAFSSWFNVYWYTLMMLGNVFIMTTFETGYARLLPSVIGDEALDRASGIISITTNISKILSYAAGPFLAHFLGTGTFMIVAALAAGSAILFARLPSTSDAVIDAQGTNDRRRAAIVARLREGLAYLITRSELVMLFALLAIMNLAWGIDQVIAMKVAEDYLAVPSQWVGSYLSISSFGGVCGAFLISCGAITSRGHIVRKVAIGVISFGLMAAGLLVTASTGIGFALKCLAGSLSTVIGLLTQAALVLRAAPQFRGRLQALSMSISGIMLLAGKSLVGLLSQHLSVYGIYTMMGLSVATLALAVVGFSSLRSSIGRVSRAPTPADASRQLLTP